MFAKSTWAKRAMRATALGAVVVVGATLAACSSTGGGDAENKFVIGFQEPIGGQAWRETGLSALQALAARPEYKDIVELKIVRTDNNDAAAQNSAMQDLVASGVDALLFDPASATGADAAIAQAKAAGIPVIAAGGPYENEYVYTVTTDWGTAGTIGANWLLDNLGTNKDIVVLEGAAGVPLNDLSMPGIEKVLTDGGANIVAKGTNAWNEADAQKNMAAILQSNPGVGGVYSFLTGGQGVPQAFADAGIPFVPVVGGSGYNGEACTLAKYADKGLTGDMVFGQPAIYAKALEQTVKLLQGETIEKTQMFPPLEITVDNAADFCVADQPDNFQLGYDFPGLNITLEEFLVFHKAS